MTEFSPNHQRVLATGFVDIHRRLDELETLLAKRSASSNPSPFSDHVEDISPTAVRVIQDYCARIRDTMLACLQENGIPLAIRRTSTRWTLQTRIESLRVAIAELGPRKLTGYGTLSHAARDQLAKIQNELERLVDRVDAYLRQGLGQDLATRLDRLDACPGAAATLTKLNRVVSRWQLVEFRPLIGSIVKRLECPEFEIAVFGRVNSGKSSLLNHIVGTDVLPVGVTPITAVPTRLIRGDDTFATIQFAEQASRQIPFKELVDYASEEKNPANRRHVTAITVHVPFAQLHDGVVFVDTPGIGSLAVSGASETLAYLPRCDLGVLLLDAATALGSDDVAVLQTLYEAGIPTQVLVSKADLLTPADQDRTVHYVREQLRRELDIDVQVHLVSTMRSHEALLMQWFDHEIKPLFQQHTALTEKSLERKVANLRETVIAVLETIALRHTRTDQAGSNQTNLQLVSDLLTQADNAIVSTKARCRDWTTSADSLADTILQDLAKQLVQSPTAAQTTNNDLATNVIRAVLGQHAEMARQTVLQLRHTLQNALETGQLVDLAAGTGIATIRDFPCRELPVLVLTGLFEQPPPVAPRWRDWNPRFAISVLRHRLNKRIGSTIRNVVAGYNNQLGIWMKDRVAQLIDIYQAEADVLRTQLRRITVKAAPDKTADDLQQLLDDLGELKKDMTC